MAISKVRTSAGTTLSISAATPATNDVAGFTAVTGFQVIGELSDLGSFGKKYNLVTFIPLGDRKTVKRKGSYNNGTLSLKMGSNVTDPGQLLLKQAVDSDNSYTFKVVQTQTGSTYFFTGQTMSAVLEIGSVDQITGLSVDIELDNDVVPYNLVA